MAVAMRRLLPGVFLGCFILHLICTSLYIQVLTCNTHAQSLCSSLSQRIASRPAQPSARRAFLEVDVTAAVCLRARVTCWPLYTTLPLSRMACWPFYILLSHPRLAGVACWPLYTRLPLSGHLTCSKCSLEPTHSYFHA